MGNRFPVDGFGPEPPPRLSRHDFRKVVNFLVRRNGFAVSVHLKRDHPERRISHVDIEACLLLGTVQDNPFINHHGNWQAPMVRHRAGEALIVVVAIEWAERIIVVTAYRPG